MFSEIASSKYYRLMILLAIELPTATEIDVTKKLLSEIDTDILYKCTCEHEMESVIYPNLKELYEGKLPDIWEDKYIQTKNRIKFMVSKLGEIAERLDEIGVPLIALKNGGIAVAFMDDLAKCPMGDIDTLVNKTDFIETHRILIDKGFKFKFRSEYEFEDLQQAFMDGGTEYYYSDNDGSVNEMWFELSWRPIAGRWIRLDKEPNAQKLINDSNFIKDSKIRILSPEDNLLQVAIHTAKHSYVREPGFRLHLEVERIVKHSNIDWELFSKKVEEVGTKTAVYYSLYIAKQLFNTPIPEHTLQELKPNKIKDRYITKALKKAQLLHPTSKKFTKIGFVFFQLMLYDNLADIIRVIFPSAEWIKKKYGFKLPILYPCYLIIWMLDLVGVRKKK